MYDYSYTYIYANLLVVLLNLHKYKLYNKLTYAVHYIKILRDIYEYDIEVKQYIVELFHRNKKMDLIPEHYKIMFDG